MEKVIISQRAQDALVKLLVKLQLIDPVNALGKYSSFDLCPIAYYAGKNAYKEWEAIKKVAAALGITSYKIDKANFEQHAKVLNEELISRIHISRWAGIRAAPIRLDDREIVIIMANPLDYEARSMLEFEFGRPVAVGLGREDEILALLSTKQKSSGFIFDLDLILNEVPEQPATTNVAQTVEHEQNLVNDDCAAAPIVRLVNKILSNSVHNGASDIHLTPEKDSLLVRVRVDGIMRPLLTVPGRMKDLVTARLKVLAGMDISEKRKPQDGRIRIKTGLGIKDLRISTVPTMFGENIVARILSSEVQNVSFESLGVPVELREKLGAELSRSSRVVLVAGPTGSGKTSTLYAGLLHLADGKRNIITVEDPIEYRVGGVTQIQVNPKTGMTFASGLRSILRQDPDVIMVGEIRDQETASIAMQTAQTGHLVLSTIHTNTAPAAITRLKDLGVPAYLIASSVGSIVAQRLVRLLCPHCAVPVSGATLARCQNLKLDPTTMKEAKGCDECSQQGYRGRTGIYSFFRITAEVQEAIRLEKGEVELAQLAKASGFRTLEEDGLTLALNGITSLAEIERVLGPLGEAPLHLSTTTNPQSLAPSAQAPNATSAILEKPKILIVEDDRDMVEVLSILLEREMYEVDKAYNGYQALEKVYQQCPDFILCDYMMPQMNGLELVTRLRRDPRTATIPILMLTAIDSEEAELQLMNGGADDFVSKASKSDIMLARIRALLGRSQIRQ